MNEEKKIILEKLLDRDEEEPEVGEHIFNHSKVSFIYILYCFEVSYIFYGSILFFFTYEKNHILNLLLFSIAIDPMK